MLCLLVALAASGLPARAEDESAEQFFSGLADRLLKRQFPFGVTSIPVAPTNEYSPAVHRLLQVTANLYEATRTNRLPCVFRPLFGSNATGVIITGYTNDPRRSTLDAYLVGENRYGIPLVIGAKKGFPNFNEYTLRTDIQVARKLELVRTSTNSPPHQTNQMYVLGISNLFAAEAWNAYSTPYSNELTLEVRNLAHVSVTNQAGLSYVPTVSLMSSGPMTLPSNFWQGGEFKLPLFTNVVLLPNSAYKFATQSFDPLSTNQFERGIGYPLPEWFLALSNRFWFILSEGDHLVDFAQFHDLTTTVDVFRDTVAAPLLIGANGVVEDDVVFGLWDTNRFGGSTNPLAPTRGVLRQLHVSLGNEPVSDTVWLRYNASPTSGQSKDRLIDVFRVFCGLTPLRTYRVPPWTSALAIQAPFSPLRKIVKTTTWQANDPLVHTHVGDLLFFPSNSITEAIVPPAGPIPTNLSLATLGVMNRRYSPWGGNPYLADYWNPGPDDYNPALKDPGIWRADAWDFPTGQPLDISWIGRVHRGTPWQTLYLKHTEPEANEWEWRELSADYLWYPPPPADQRRRFVRTHPTNDWALASLLAEFWNTNLLQQRVSINSRDPAAWASVWNGVTVLSNNLSDEFWYQISQPTPPSFDTFTMTSNSPQAAVLSVAVTQVRASQPGGYFRDLADILTVRELSTASPWLNRSSFIQLQRGLTDAAIEAIPAQVLSRLRADPIVQFSPRSGVLTVSFPPGEGGSCLAESSADLEHWSPVGEPVTITKGIGQVTLPAQTNPDRRFFRAKIEPAP